MLADSVAPARSIFTRVARALAVTAALVVLGGLLGAATAVASIVLVALPNIWREGALLSVLLTSFFAAYVGAALGGMIAPVLGWILLRRLAIHRSIRATPVGALAGAFLALLGGWLLTDLRGDAGILYVTGGATVGVLATAVWLRLKYNETGSIDDLATAIASQF